MIRTFEVDNRIADGCLTELILPAELGEVELQLAAHPLLIRDLIENMQFMVDLLYVFQTRESEGFQLMQAADIVRAPEQHGV